MASTVTTFDFALKENYDESEVENLTLSERPFMAKLTKNEDFSGDSLVTPLIVGNPQGIAGSGQATASTNETSVRGFKFVATPGDYAASVSIGDKVLKLSRNNKGAFLENQFAEIDGLYEQVADNLAEYLWGNGGQAIGQISAVNTTSNVITLTDPTKAVNFEVGMTIVTSEGDGSDAAHTLQSGSVVVSAVDRINGTVTYTGTDPTGIDADDYIFRQGDFFGDTGVIVMKGFYAFIDASGAPPALWGMTRTSDPQRLAGCYVPTAQLTGKGVEQRIRLLGAYMAGRYKAKGPWDLYLHPEDWETLETSLESRGIRALEDDSTKFGFTKLTATFGGVKCSIFSDKNAKKGTCAVVRHKNWKLHSPGKLIQTLNGDGLTMLRKTSNDYEYRLVSYPILMCNAPGYSGRVALT
jgi:hypothetical protein